MNNNTLDLIVETRDINIINKRFDILLRDTSLEEVFSHYTENNKYESDSCYLIRNELDEYSDNELLDHYNNGVVGISIFGTNIKQGYIQLNKTHKLNIYLVSSYIYYKNKDKKKTKIDIIPANNDISFLLTMNDRQENDTINFLGKVWTMTKPEVIKELRNQTNIDKYSKDDIKFLIDNSKPIKNNIEKELKERNIDIKEMELV